MSQLTNIQRRHLAVLNALYFEGPLTSAGLARVLGLESAEVLFYGRRLSHILGDMGQKQAGLIERTGEKSRLGRGKLLPEFQLTQAGLQLRQASKVVIPQLLPLTLTELERNLHLDVTEDRAPHELLSEYVARKRSELGIGQLPERGRAVLGAGPETTARSISPEEAERLEWADGVIVAMPAERKSNIIELRQPLKVFGATKSESKPEKEDTWRPEPDRELRAVPPPTRPVPKTPAYPVVGKINDELDDQAKLRSWIAQARANNRPESASYGEVMLRMLQRQEKIEAGLLAIADAVYALLRPPAESKAS